MSQSVLANGIRIAAGECIIKAIAGEEAWLDIDARVRRCRNVVRSRPFPSFSCSMLAIFLASGNAGGPHLSDVRTEMRILLQGVGICTETSALDRDTMALEVMTQ